MLICFTSLLCRWHASWWWIVFFQHKTCRKYVTTDRNPLMLTADTLPRHSLKAYVSVALQSCLLQLGQPRRNYKKSSTCGVEEWSGWSRIWTAIQGWWMHVQCWAKPDKRAADARQINSDIQASNYPAWLVSFEEGDRGARQPEPPVVGDNVFKDSRAL